MKRFPFLLLLTILLAGCTPPTAIPAAAGLPTPTAALSASDQEAFNELDSFLTTLSTEPAYVGTELGFVGSVLVARNGNILLCDGYGEANREMKALNTAQTKFRIASITKEFTAMAILILQARGMLDVQDRVCTYISNCPLAWQTITLHHLLTHTSGIPDYYSSPDWASFQAAPASPAELMAHFMDEPLDFPPGERWNYSNSGYVVLGNIIEQVAGTSYEEFLIKNIFDPLEMVNTGYLENTGALAVGYANLADAASAEFEHMSGLYSAGGLYSTVGDLFLWDQSLFTDRLLPEDLRVKMFTSYASIPDSDGFGYGYGWMIGEIANRRVVFHSGRIEGFTGINYYYPDDKVVVIVLSNQHDGSVSSIGVQLANIVLSIK